VEHSVVLGLEANVLTLDRFGKKIQVGTLTVHWTVGRNDGDDDDIKHTKCLITINNNNNC